jgi:tetratricopeptide (TPR) repeat protein
MFLSLVFNNYDEMKLSAEKFLELRKPSWHLLSGHAIHSFISGLASFLIYRETADPFWALQGERFRQRLKSWEEQGSLWNFENKTFLLDAEKSFNDGDLEIARVSYENAIASSRHHKFIHEEALAYELAASFYLNTGNESIALKYFIRAHCWGSIIMPCEGSHEPCEASHGQCEG